MVISYVVISVVSDAMLLHIIYLFLLLYTRPPDHCFIVRMLHAIFLTLSY